MNVCSVKLLNMLITKETHSKHIESKTARTEEHLKAYLPFYIPLLELHQNDDYLKSVIKINNSKTRRQKVELMSGTTI